MLRLDGASSGSAPVKWPKFLSGLLEFRHSDTPRFEKIGEFGDKRHAGIGAFGRSGDSDDRIIRIVEDSGKNSENLKRGDSESFVASVGGRHVKTDLGRERLRYPHT